MLWSFKRGRDQPSYSTDPPGTLVYICDSGALTFTLQIAAEGARIELGSTEIYANSTAHSPNGRFVDVFGIHTVTRLLDLEAGRAEGSSAHAVQGDQSKIWPLGKKNDAVKAGS